MTRILKSKLFTIGIKITFASFAFWFLSKKLDYSQLPELFYTMNYNLLFAALLLQFISIAIAAYRWKLVMHSLGFGEDNAFYQKLYFKGFFFSQALPGSIGGDAIRLIALKDQGYKISDSLYGIFIDRVVGLIGLLLISLFALLFAPVFLTSTIINTVLFIGVGGLAGFLILLILHKVINFSHLPKLHIFGELSKRFFKVYSNSQKGILQISLSIIIHFFSILCIYSISVAANLGVEFEAFLCLMPLVILLTILPISFAGWGVREGAMVGLFSMSGANKEAIMAVSIAYGVILILSSLPGFVTWLNSKNIA
ncbi:MAG: lysylphosphatidylglycerol synthase transmembrane domain-containing protein [Sulfuricurvum sp.]|nr:lysylphosphatidylglycerol synthase transmembrane domain-containing protein [Sulfuricurvum sp.]